MMLRNTCDSLLSMPGTTSSRHCLAIASTRRGASSVRVASIDLDQRAQHRRDVDRLQLDAAELRVEPRGVGDVGDQPVEPLDVVEDDRHQPPLLCRIVDPHRGLDRAAQRGERVLDLMRDIGGKTLDRAHALPQRVGHLAQRPREIADLVAAPGEVGYFDPRPTAARALRRGGEPADRPRDRAREIE